MLAKALQGAAVAAQPGAYIEDVFSTYLYTGNSTTGGTQTITNNIDLSTKGGMVWIKGRSTPADHILTDTVRGAGTTATNNKALSSDLTAAESLGASYDFVSAFNNNGFTVKQGGASSTTQSANYNNVTYGSWSFRKQEKFFDVVTFTTASSGSNVINHSLNSLPGCIIVKTTGITQDWYVWHRSLASNEYLVLNTTAAKASGVPTISVSSTQVTFGSGWLTASRAYVMYLFAHDAGGFGAAGTDNVISCGSFTSDGSGNATVTLGYEPQWLLIKQSSGTAQGWWMFDTMRGWNMGNNDVFLSPNNSGAETAGTYGNPTATGFQLSSLNASQTHIYIAIRRGPMRTPTSGTSVFNPVLGAGTTPGFSSSFTVDSVWMGFKTGNAAYPNLSARLFGENYQIAPNIGVLQSGAGTWKYDFQTGFGSSVFTSGYIGWLMRRAPGFHDVVCYTGTGANRDINHNLGVVPELILIKCRSASVAWAVYSASLANTEYLVLNTNAAKATSTSYWNSTTPTSTTFRVGLSGSVNSNTDTYTAWLFATVAGVSKVGSYTGNGSSQTINCGFAAGARFIMIKRTDSTGDWYVWDTTRGIVAGNDPRISLNSTAAEVTTDDTIDPDNSGFIVNQLAATNVNVTSATYIYLAIA